MRALKALAFLGHGFMTGITVASARTSSLVARAEAAGGGSLQIAEDLPFVTFNYTAPEGESSDRNFISLWNYPDSRPPAQNGELTYDYTEQRPEAGSLRISEAAEYLYPNKTYQAWYMYEHSSHNLTTPVIFHVPLSKLVYADNADDGGFLFNYSTVHQGSSANRVYILNADVSQQEAGKADYVTYQAANGLSGQVKIPKDELQLGKTYQAWFFADGERENLLASPVEFFTGAITPANLSLAHEAPYLSFNYTSPNNKISTRNWIGIWRDDDDDAPQSNELTFRYTEEDPAGGQLTLTEARYNLYPGKTYKAYYIEHGTRNALAGPITYTVPNGTIEIDRTQNPFTFRYSSLYTKTSNFIGIYQGSYDRAEVVRAYSVSHSYAHNDYNGTLFLDKENLVPGKYYAAWFWADDEKKNLLAPPLHFFAEAATLRYNASKPDFTFQYETPSYASAYNWVAVHNASQGLSGKRLTWEWAPGYSGDTVVNSALMTPGNYSLFWFYDPNFFSAYLFTGGYRKQLAPPVNFTVPWGTIELNQSQGPLTYNYFTHTPDEDNWVALYNANDTSAPNKNYIDWRPAGLRNGTVHFDATKLPPGNYTALLLANDGYELLARPSRAETPPSDLILFDACADAYTFSYMSTAKNKVLAIFPADISSPTDLARALTFRLVDGDVGTVTIQANGKTPSLFGLPSMPYSFRSGPKNVFLLSVPLNGPSTPTIRARLLGVDLSPERRVSATAEGVCEAHTRTPGLATQTAEDKPSYSPASTFPTPSEFVVPTYKPPITNTAVQETTTPASGTLAGSSSGPASSSGSEPSSTGTISVTSAETPGGSSVTTGSGRPVSGTSAGASLDSSSASSGSASSGLESSGADSILFPATSAATSADNTASTSEAGGSSPAERSTSAPASSATTSGDHDSSTLETGRVSSSADGASTGVASSTAPSDASTASETAGSSRPGSEPGTGASSTASEEAGSRSHSGSPTGAESSTASTDINSTLEISTRYTSGTRSSTVSFTASTGTELRSSRATTEEFTSSFNSRATLSLASSTQEPVSSSMASHIESPAASSQTGEPASSDFASPTKSSSSISIESSATRALGSSSVANPTERSGSTLTRISIDSSTERAASASLATSNTGTGSMSTYIGNEPTGTTMTGSTTFIEESGNSSAGGATSSMDSPGSSTDIASSSTSAYIGSSIGTPTGTAGSSTSVSTSVATSSSTGIAGNSEPGGSPTSSSTDIADSSTSAYISSSIGTPTGTAGSSTGSFTSIASSASTSSSISTTSTSTGVSIGITSSASTSSSTGTAGSSTSVSTGSSTSIAGSSVPGSSEKGRTTYISSRISTAGVSAATKSASITSSISEPSVSLYIPTVVGPYKLFGCSQSDKRSNGLKLVRSSDTMTLEQCGSLCKDTSFAVHIRDCYCGDAKLDTFATKVSAARCNIPCPGNSAEACGGDVASSARLMRREILTSQLFLAYYKVSFSSFSGGLSQLVTSTDSRAGTLSASTSEQAISNSAASKTASPSSRLTASSTSSPTVSGEADIICYGNYCLLAHPSSNGDQQRKKVICSNDECHLEGCTGNDCDQVYIVGEDEQLEYSHCLGDACRKRVKVSCSSATGACTVERCTTGCPGKNLVCHDGSCAFENCTPAACYRKIACDSQECNTQPLCPKAGCRVHRVSSTAQLTNQATTTAKSRPSTDSGGGYSKPTGMIKSSRPSESAKPGQNGNNSVGNNSVGNGSVGNGSGNSNNGSGGNSSNSSSGDGSDNQKGGSSGSSGNSNNSSGDSSSGGNSSGNSSGVSGNSDNDSQSGNGSCRNSSGSNGNDKKPTGSQLPTAAAGAKYQASNAIWCAALAIILS